MNNNNLKCNELEYINLSKLVNHDGNPLYNDISDFVVFDLETTGLSPEDAEIINIGAIRYRNNEPVSELDILVKPQKRIPALITEITGITNKMVEGKPSIQEALPILLDFIGNDVILGHNVKFDLGFLNHALKKCGYNIFMTKYVDTLTIARSFRKHNRLEELVRDYLDPSFAQDHLALSDARYTAEIFKVFKEMDIQSLISDNTTKCIMRF